MIPPDPAHEAKMAALRAENAQLLQNKIESWKRCSSVYQKSRRPHDNPGRSFIMKNNGIGLVGWPKNSFQVLYSFHLHYIQVCITFDILLDGNLFLTLHYSIDYSLFCQNILMDGLSFCVRRSQPSFIRSV